MRTVPLTSLSALLAVLTAALIWGLPEDVAVALVVAPLVLCIVGGLLLTLRVGGWHRSRGLKELLLYGPLQPDLDKWTHRIARVPTIFLTLIAAVAVGALVGIIVINVLRAAHAA